MRLQVGEAGEQCLMPLLSLGIAMLSSVLNSDKAIEVNISIIRSFVKNETITIINIHLNIALINIFNNRAKISVSACVPDSNRVNNFPVQIL